MTDRKPPQQTFPTWIDQQIAEAERRGVFDNLPGTGRPLPPRRESDFTQAWLRDKLRREGVPAEEMLPTPLRLRREAERLRGGPASLRSEAEVREAVAELNTRILDWRRNSTDDGPPIPVPLVKEDQAVAAWHQTRAAEIAAAGPPAPDPAEHAPEPSGRRWPWPRRRR
jgi:hypothetical protein